MNWGRLLVGAWLVCLIGFLLTGCEVITPNEKIFLQVNNECPIKCNNKNKIWSGMLKAKSDTLNCVCDDEGPSCPNPGH